ncbi:MAG TPA: cytidine deaminase [Polyangiaceae bacterium]|nr:cytidine deaminase [Polyangiaceae bacterium]
MSQALEPELGRLVALARDARTRAYAPYSKFLVGAAVESRSGAVFSGANVENATYGATICAERSAIVQMVAAGERELSRVAVYSEAATLAMPCGICRQVMSEFGREVTVVAAGPAGARVLTLADLLPEPFRLLP